MPVFQFRMSELIFKYINDEISLAEVIELTNRLQESPEFDEIFVKANDINWWLERFYEMYSIDEEKAWQNILKKAWG